MLLEFSCENYKSIKNKVTLSFIAGKNQSKSKIICHDKYKILKKAVIYGANGSGKSNLLQAMGEMQNIVVSSYVNELLYDIPMRSHMLASDEIPISYEAKYVSENKIFVYGFSIKNKIISEEYLYVHNNDTMVAIFTRENSNININEKYKIGVDAALETVKDNRLLLSCVANFSKNEYFRKAYIFFSGNVVFYTFNFSRSWLNYTINQIKNDEKIKKQVILLLNKMGIDIHDIVISIDDKIDLEETNNDILRSSSRRVKNVNNVKLDYGLFKIDLKYESSGVQRLISMIGPIIDILRNGKLLICDELESNFHEMLVQEVIKLFDVNNDAQLLFTTHDTSLLSSELFERDQVWFTEMNPQERSTELYSLLEFKEIDIDYARGYIRGKYGAVPMLDKAGIRSFAEGDF